MSPDEAAALAAIDAAFAKPVLYTGGGLPEPAIIDVIWSDTAGQRFQGAGNTTRTVSCEVCYADLRRRPDKSDRILRGSTIWKPNQVVDRDDIGKWDVVLEKVGAAT